ncbi:DNA repair and recombination protein RAD5C, partial [Pyrenophora tritici-repentis]
MPDSLIRDVSRKRRLNNKYQSKPPEKIAKFIGKIANSEQADPFAPTERILANAPDQPEIDDDGQCTPGFGDLELEYISHSGVLSREGCSDLNSLGDTDNLSLNLDINTAISDPEEIYFGMLPGLPVRFNKGVDPLMITKDSQVDPGSTELHLTFLESYCEIKACSGGPLGVLNTASFRQLSGLPPEIKIRLTGQLSLANSSHEGNNSKDNDSPRLRSLDVLVFGFRSQAKIAAAKLAANGIYLQEPDQVPWGYVYENPQYLDLPVLPQSDEGSANIISDTRTAGVLHAQSVESETDLDFDKMLGTFACHNGLGQATAVGQVSNTLFSHQKEGLDFIQQRESGSVPASRALWEQVQDKMASDGPLMFRHIITGAINTKRQECLGGLIADEMGLGKSLTMLSGIVGSLDQAIRYAKSVTKIGTSANDIIAAKSTLILVPSHLLIDTWIDEIHNRITPGGLSYYVFHGSGRKIAYPLLLTHDIVFTTYGTVTAEYTRNRSLLHHIHWYRIVLDEAHMIRNAATKQFGAVNALQALLRWCLTGTPIQNSLDDLGSLTTFLKVPILENTAQFKRHIVNPIEHKKERSRKDHTGLRTLLTSICLRRTTAVLPLSDVTEVTELKRIITFTSSERAQYAQIERLFKKALDSEVNGGKIARCHQKFLEFLLLLRLFCNNGSTREQSGDQGGRTLKSTEETLSLIQQQGREECYFCECNVIFSPGSAETGMPLITDCLHVVCDDCIPRWKHAASKVTHCPICKKFHICQPETQHTKAAVAVHTVFPSKIMTLYEDIQAHCNDSKSIVFSFWKRSLDMVAALLTVNNVSFVRVDGSVPFNKRKAILNDFKCRNDISVLLMTFGTGAVGLNSLSIANRVHILAPQWNPSVEHQAIGRVVRLGQQNPVTIVRYIVDKTVEENVQSKQLVKLRLADGGFTHGK